MSLRVIKTVLLLSLAEASTSGAKLKNHNRTDRSDGSCSLFDHTNRASCIRSSEALLCTKGFTSDWLFGVRYEILHLKLLQWPGHCFNVGHLQRHFPQLYTLEISNSMNLKIFKGFFDSSSKVEKISMHGLTSLWEVPEVMVEKMTQLRVLDLRNNTLRHMKVNLIRGPPQLETVYLGDNKWDCSDGGLDWLAMENENGTVRKKLADYYQLVCHQQLYRGKPLYKVMDIIRMVKETCPGMCACAMTHVVSDAKGAIIPLITVNCTSKALKDPPASLPPSTTTLRLERNKVTCKTLLLSPDYRLLGNNKKMLTGPLRFPTNNHAIVVINSVTTNINKNYSFTSNKADKRLQNKDIKKYFSRVDNSALLTSIRQLVQFPQYQSLMDLYLDNNSIQSVKELEGSEWFSTFRVLSLRGNLLKQIPVYAFDKAFQGNNNIMHVYLGHNPWRCDCHFIPRFQGLLLKYKRVIRDLTDIRCAKSDDKTISFVQISTMALGHVCRSSEVNMPISTINIVNLVLLVLILMVVGRFLYDWHRFRATGKLPWISSVMP